MRRLWTESLSEWMNNRARGKRLSALTPYCHYTCGFHQDILIKRRLSRRFSLTFAKLLFFSFRIRSMKRLKIRQRARERNYHHHYEEGNSNYYKFTHLAFVNEFQMKRKDH